MSNRHGDKKRTDSDVLLTQFRIKLRREKKLHLSQPGHTQVKRLQTQADRSAKA